MARQQKDFTPDVALELKDAGLVAASAAALVDAAAKIIDLGASGRVDGRVIVDITAIEIDTTDEIYRIAVQVSSSATFASVIKNVTALQIGHTTADAVADTGVVGRYELPFCNEVNGTTYRYLRLYTYVAGTIATGINYTAWAVKAA